MKNSPVHLVATSAAVALVLAACAPGGGSATGTSDGPIRIAYLNILSGPQAIQGQAYPLELATKEINDAGGINGRQIEFKAFDTGITPEGATKATSLALEYQPMAVIGYSVSSGLKASVPSLRAAGIPVLHDTLSSLTSAQSLGYDRAFRMTPTTTQLAEAANRYLIDELHVKSLLMLHTQDAGPSEGAEKVVASAQRAGARIVERAVPPSVTDLTEPILAARGLDAVWVWGYATTNALAIKQAAQNSVRLPIMTVGLEIAINNRLLPDNPATKDIYSVSRCGAPVRGTPKPKEFVADFTAAYGSTPGDSYIPNSYDGMYLLKAAIEKARSTDGAKVAEALKTVTLDGACGTVKADANNNMYHDVAVTSWVGAKSALAELVENLHTDF
jgi:branched-chain amino acid transport system substrate-binding protein